MIEYNYIETKVLILLAIIPKIYLLLNISNYFVLDHYKTGFWLNRTYSNCSKKYVVKSCSNFDKSIKSNHNLCCVCLQNIWNDISQVAGLISKEASEACGLDYSHFFVQMRPSIVELLRTIVFFYHSLSVLIAFLFFFSL